MELYDERFFWIHMIGGLFLKINGQGRMYTVCKH